MKKMAWISLLLLMACGGSLSEEQRKRLHEGMDNQKIVKVSDSDIVTASLDRGRTVFAALEQIKFDSLQIDSVARQFHARVKWLVPGSTESLEVENQMIEAYVIGAETGSTQDNIQKLHRSTESEEYDSLLYTRPVVTTMADGVIQVDGVWNIYLAKKDVVLSLGKE
jgi:ribosome maturation protein Sdo1